MKHILLFLLALLSLPLPAQNPGWRQKIAPDVLTAVDRGERAAVLVVLREQADLSPARSLRGKTAKAEFVAAQLQATAARTQEVVLQLVRTDALAGANSLWVVNAVAVEAASPGLIRDLAALPEVARVAADPWVEFDAPTVGAPVVADRSAVEWGVLRINAPAVWDLGYTGQGITIGGADTGYDWLHPALRPHYRGWNAEAGTADHNYNWHDAIHEPSPLASDSLNPCGFDVLQPCDDYNPGHGTHTMGTMTGDDSLGNQIGVAPGARWIGCRNMERGNGRPSTYLECFQWFLAPTDLNGQNPDPTRAPDVINNSWTCTDGEGCFDATIENVLRQAVIALKAGGTVVVASAGNSGPGCSSIVDPPAYFAESFTVGATAFNDTIAGFSSRGPVTADSSMRIKPDVAAPGVFVRSSVPNGEYQYLNGTSMAGPHVAGLVALVLSARPDLIGEVELIEQLVRETAVPKFDASECLGASGQVRPNHVYGYGRVDALAAVLAILDVVPVTEPATAMTVRAFPNPALTDVTFELRHVRGAAALELFDAAGRSVAAQRWTAVDAGTVTISLRGLPAGLYGWRMTAASGSVSGKIVKRI
jgi:serine protease AprX